MSCKVHQCVGQDQDPVQRPARRDFLFRAAGSGALLAFPGAVMAAQLGEVMGELYVNGFRAPPGTKIKAGDSVLTGPETKVSFAVGQDAFMMRPLTSLQIDGSTLISGLRVLTGGLLAVFGRGAERTIRTATLTAGIRGTGIYVEASSIMSYFCTCYGEVDLECVTYQSRLNVKTKNHAAHFIYGKVDSGRSIVKAPVVNHTNAELAELEKMVGRTSPLG
ncbi:MAG: hypothetical protein K2Y31_16215 [Burkholderiales bacterium]|jgi:hypothetical protein|nr:hypothetical protein [Burkholderiales bacterium]